MSTPPLMLISMSGLSARSCSRDDWAPPACEILLLSLSLLALFPLPPFTERDELRSEPPSSPLLPESCGLLLLQRDLLAWARFRAAAAAPAALGSSSLPALPLATFVPPPLASSRPGLLSRLPPLRPPLPLLWSPLLLPVPLLPSKRSAIFWLARLALRENGLCFCSINPTLAAKPAMVASICKNNAVAA